MALNKALLPNTILEARDFAIKSNPEDTKGFHGCRINMDRSSEAQGVVYHNWEVNALGADGIRSWKGCYVETKTIPSCGNIQPPVGVDNTKRKWLQIKVKFHVHHNNTYRKMIIDKNGCKHEEIQRLGEAIEYLCEAFVWHVNKLLADGSIYMEGAKIITQLITKVPIKQSDGKTKVEILKDPMYRVEIPFNIKNNAVDITSAPTIPIFTTAKAIPGKSGLAKFPLLTYSEIVKENNKDVVKEISLAYNNIYKLLKYGTKFTGIINMSSMNISSQGISLPMKFTDKLYVEPSKGGKVTAEDTYGDEDVDDMDASHKNVEGEGNEFLNQGASEPNPSPAKAPEIKPNNTEGELSDDMNNLNL